MIPIVMGGFDLRVDFVLLSRWIKLQFARYIPEAKKKSF